MAILKTIKKLSENDGATEQFNGREGETATLLLRFFLNSELRVIGFAPRHLSRYAASSVRVVKIMAKLRWGNGETNTGGNPYVTEKGASSDLQSYDRVNIKDGKRKLTSHLENLQLSLIQTLDIY